MTKRQMLWRGGAILGLLAAPAVLPASPSSALEPAGADLQLKKSCTPATSTLLPGDTVTCMITVKNLSPDVTSLDLEITDDLPSGLTVVSATGTGTTACSTTNIDSPEVFCTRGALGPGESTVVTVVSTVNGNVGPDRALTDTAKVNSKTTFDPNTLNNVDSATVNTVGCTVDSRNATSGQTITGTAGDDVICGSAFADIIDGLGGNDIIFGLGGDDVINGGAGNDRIFGGTGDDILNGNAGDDMLFGGAGRDILDGGAGFDRLDGGADVDGCTGEVKTSCEE